MHEAARLTGKSSTEYAMVVQKLYTMWNVEAPTQRAVRLNTTR